MFDARISWEGVIGPLDPCIVLSSRTDFPKIDHSCALTISYGANLSVSLKLLGEPTTPPVELVPGEWEFLARIAAHPRVVIIEPGVDETCEPEVYFADIVTVGSAVATV